MTYPTISARALVARLAAALVVLAVPGSAIATDVAFDSGQWTFVNADTVRIDGQLAMAGFAVLTDVEFQDGVVEVDVLMNGARSYPGIIFRMQSEAEFERVYLRPHRAGLYTDAIQYTPTFNGMEGWQLYNGDGYTAGAEMPKDQWIHFKIEVLGKQARVFLDNATEPSLVINDLKHGISIGGLGLQGPRNATARFANFSYRADDGLEFPPPPEAEARLGVYTTWELSQGYAAREINFGKPIAEQTHADAQWQTIESEPSGLVDIARFVAPARGEASAVWAKTIIHADYATTKKLNFGYSDYADIFLNGELLFSGNSAYQYRDPSFLGVAGLFDAVPLHLRAGDNELTLLIAESFGGWGFMAQDGDAKFQHERLVSAWETGKDFKYPESVVYDPKRDVLYVSNFAVSGPGYISKVRVNGQIETIEWASGLNRPTGLCLFEDRLYAVERTGLAEINPETAEIVSRYPIPGARFPNDVTVSSDGDIYVSGSASGAIFKKSADGEFALWLQDPAVAQANGILADGNRLLVGCSRDGTVKSVDLATKEISTFATLGAGVPMDGLASDGNGNYIVGDNNGRIFAVTADGAKTMLLNTTVVEMNCADLAFIPSKNMIVVPTWLDQRVVAYQFTPE